MSTAFVVCINRKNSSKVIEALDEAEYAILHTRDVDEALRWMNDVFPDFVLVLGDLRDAQIREYCKRLRGRASNDQLPVLVVTGSNGFDHDLAFHMGLEVHLTGATESKLITRYIRRLMRDSQPSQNESRIETQGLVMDRKRQTASIHGRYLNFTPAEFRLLWVLANNPVRVFSRSELIDAYHDDLERVSDRVIDVHVKGIRQKLGPDAVIVETVRSVGYRLRERKEKEEVQSVAS